MLLGLDFVPLDHIHKVSLNGPRGRDETNDRTKIVIQIMKPSIALDSRCQVLARGTSLQLFLCLETFVLDHFQNEYFSQ